MRDISTSSVRQRLAQATAPEHTALHTHPWISQLAHPELDLADYATILTAYLTFFCQIEATRKNLNVFEHLSLCGQIAAIEQDLLITGIDVPSFGTDCKPLADQKPLAVLGALYVLHGAGFGAKTLNVNVRKTLPSAPRNYLSLGTTACVWRDLLSILECTASNCAEQQILFKGAALTFERFGRSVTQICEGSAGHRQSITMHAQLVGRKIGSDLHSYDQT